MGDGEYGASVAGPGFGTERGAGSGGSVARCCAVSCALAPLKASAVRNSGVKADQTRFLLIVPVFIGPKKYGKTGASWTDTSTMKPVYLFARAKVGNWRRAALI